MQIFARGARPLACASLCAAGTVVGLVAVQTELALQIPSTYQALVVAALLVGVMLGLWLPRRVMLQRLVNEWVRSAEPVAQPDDRGLAASIAGVVLLALGLAWSATAALLLGYETFRELIVRPALLPLRMVQLLLVGPAVVLSANLGAVGAVAAVVLLGWYRRVLAPHPHYAAFVVLPMVLAGGAALVTPTALGAVLAPLSAFLAASVAAGGRSRGPNVTPANQSPVRALPRFDSTALMIVCLGALAVLALPIAASGASVARVAAAACGAAPAGLLLGRELAGRRAAFDAIPLMALASGVILILGGGPTALWVFALLAGGAAFAGCLVVARGMQRGASALAAVSHVGVLLCGGGACGALYVAVASNGGAGALGMPRFVIVLLFTGVVGLLMIVESRRSLRMRVLGFAATGLWLMVLPTAMRSSADVLGRQYDEAVAVAAGRESVWRMLAPTSPRLATVALAGGEHFAQERLTFDLQRPTPDGVLFVDGGFAAHSVALAKRLVRRAFADAAFAGPVVVELPSAPQLLRDVAQVAFDRGLGGHRLRLERDGRADATVDYAIFGRDTPKRLERASWASDLHVTLTPLRTDDVED